MTCYKFWSKFPLLVFLLFPDFLLSLESTQKLDVFLANLVLTRFPHCGLFFFRHETHSGENCLIADVVNRIGIVGYYNVNVANITGSTSTELSSFSSELLVNGRTTRKASVCKVAIISVKDVKDGKVFNQIRR